MKKILLILSVSSLLFSCARGRSSDSVKKDGSDSATENNREFVYAENIILTLGVAETIKPKEYGNNKTGSSLSCSMSMAPSWILIDSATCIVSVTSIKAGKFGPYEIEVTTAGNTTKAQLGFKVVKPDETTLPPASTPPSASKYYQSISFVSNTNYTATFSATGITFMNGTNPYAPNVIKYIPTGSLGAGAPQALASTPNFIHVATTTGHIMSFDWSDLDNPIFVHKAKVYSDGGQNYDLATDEVSKLFVANTDRNRFSVVDVSDPLNPVTEYTMNTLGSYGAGVTYANKHAYVTAYGGKIVTFGQDQNGEWGVTSEVETGILNPSRPFANDKYLIAARYSGSELDIFSLEDPSAPIHIDTLDVVNKVQLYSRSFIHDNQIYVSTIGPVSAKVLVYDIEVDNSFRLVNTFEPKDSNGNYYSQLSLGLFRNDSFLMMIGTYSDTPSERIITTTNFPLILN